MVNNKAKGRISKWMFQENKAHQVFRNTNISYPLIRTHTSAYQGVINVRFSENLACCFLETLVLRIGLLPYYRRYLVNCIPLGYWQKEDLHTIINDVDGFCENIAEKFKSKFSEQVAERMELIKMKTVTKKDRIKKYISIWTSERDERFSKVSKWQSCG